MRHVSRVLFAVLLVFPAVAGINERPARAADAAGSRPQSAGREPDFQALRAAAVRTEARLATSAACWTATIAVGGRKVKLEILQAPERKRTVVSIFGDNGQPVEIARVIERGDVWYVREPGGTPAKYRAGECPFAVASVPMFMSRAAVHIVTTSDRTALGKFEGTAEGVATYRVPLDPQSRGQIEGIVRQVEDMARQDPSLLEREGMRDRVTLFKDVLAHGSPVRVDVADGVLREWGSIASTTISSSAIRWLDRADGAEFAVDGTTWQDHATDPTVAPPEQRQDWVMLWHTLAFDPQSGKGDPDARLVDLKSGRMRRIPYEGEASIPGCFLKGRDKVIVTGMSEGKWGLYEINLKTRANRALAADVLAGRLPMSPALSPDGRTLAISAMDLSAGVGRSQVFLIDVESGKGTPLGEPFDTAYLSWAPDGKGLILISRTQPARPQDFPVCTICRMGLDGRLTPIRRGDGPVVLADGRILFEEFTADGKHWHWKACDLQGKDERLVADGLDRFGFPAPAPDGKRILMMRYDPGRGPTPYVFRIGEQPGEPALKMPGMWGSPAWR